MKQLHLGLKKNIIAFIDFFYPPFRKFVPLQTFRYAACGGANLLLSLTLFYVFFHYTVYQENFNIDFLSFHYTLKPHTAALILSFLICTPIGFYLNLFVVFPGSHLRRRVQFIRYVLVCLFNLLLNYVLLFLFVDVFHFYPTPSLIAISALVVILTYLFQENFSFRKRKH